VPTTVPPTERRALAILTVSVCAGIVNMVFLNSVAFLIPALAEAGIGLSTAGVLAGLPMGGTLLTLIGWGVLIDRIGERIALVAGLAATAAAALGAAYVPGLPGLGAMLLLGGAAAASVNAATGRVIVGWFPPHRRGLAMGVRQAAQPLGVGLGALILPASAAALGATESLLVPAALNAGAALLCLAVVRDPEPPSPAPLPAADAEDEAAPEATVETAAANPYRGATVLQRIHLVSFLLVVPQFTVWTFALVWLIDRCGWSPGSAGALIVVAQVLGGLGRMAAGSWSDIVGSRLLPIRIIAGTAGLTMGALALASVWPGPIAVALLVVASAVTVADNGLAFTAVAEAAGPSWTGRALGVQNTGQNLGATVVPPVFGAVIAALGYPAAFALAALGPAAAVLLVPRTGPDRYAVSSTGTSATGHGPG